MTTVKVEKLGSSRHQMKTEVSMRSSIRRKSSSKKDGANNLPPKHEKLKKITVLFQEEENYNKTANNKSEEYERKDQGQDLYNSNVESYNYSVDDDDDMTFEEQERLENQNPDRISMQNEQNNKKKNSVTISPNTEQCELCFLYFEKSYIWTHKTNMHKVVKEIPKRKNFRCKECLKTFELKSKLFQHKNSEHLDLEEYCNICDSKILRKDLDEHKLNVHGIKKRTNYICRQCDTCHKSRGDLQRHKFETHCLPGAGRPLVPCEICSKTFLKTSLTRHKFEVHNIRDEDNLRKGKATECKDCHTVFERRYELNKHNCTRALKEKRLKVEKSPKICDICNESVENSTIRDHKFAKHGIVKTQVKKRKNYRCHDCGEIFINKKIYISHRKITHLGMLKEFQCKLCLDSFDTKELWDEHMKEFGDHGGQFTCSICNRTFQSEGGLRMHQNKHQKKFQCEICHMNLSSNASLITHKTKHTGLKPYECQICAKTFPYSSSLKYHMRTHEDKKYVCQFCGQKFTFSFNFTRHIEQHHGTPEEKVICEHCGGLFAKHRFKDHIARHGEPTIPCELCGKKFKIMNQVRKHKNQVHKKELVRHQCPICPKAFIRKEILEVHLTKHRPDLQQSLIKSDKPGPLLRNTGTLTLPSTMDLYFDS